MSVSQLIEISTIHKKPSSQKKHVQHALSFMKMKEFSCIEISPIYRLEGGITSVELEKIAKELLCDSVIEEFSVDSAPQNNQLIFADVWYKAGVTDTVGESILKAIRDLKISSVKKAFSGTRYEFQILNPNTNGSKSAEEKLFKFANKELLNPLVQECKIIKCPL